MLFVLLQYRLKTNQVRRSFADGFCPYDHRPSLPFAFSKNHNTLVQMTTFVIPRQHQTFDELDLSSFVCESVSLVVVASVAEAERYLAGLFFRRCTIHTLACSDRRWVRAHV